MYDPVTSLGSILWDGNLKNALVLPQPMSAVRTRMLVGKANVVDGALPAVST